MTDILKLFQFIKDKEGYEIPFKQKLIYGYPLTKEELNVKGSLDLSESKITSLPDGLKVGVDINLNNCYSLTSLPDGLTVGGSLNLVGCDSLTSLPDGLTVGGFLDLYLCTSLESLPDGLTVGMDLYLGGTPIADNYTEEEIKKMYDIKGKIYL
jgi:hypothetical protein